MMEANEMGIKNNLGIKLAHIGINASSEGKALEIAEALSLVLGFAIKSGNSSIFVGDAVEIMKEPYLGTNGHIGFWTSNMRETIHAVSEKGYEVDMDTAKYSEDGEIKSVYLRKEIAGFAIHFIQG